LIQLPTIRINMTNFEIHEIQADILLTLLFKPGLRFSRLNNLSVSSDQFNFHLKTLVTRGFVEKTSDGYRLTNEGKEFANRFDTDQKHIEKQAKLSVLVCCVKTVHGKKYRLMQERHKEPYYGYLGAISGKIRWGETAQEAAKRELREETGLVGNPEFIGIEHKIDYDNKGKLLEDKFFYVFKVSDFIGHLKVGVGGGKNIWMTEEEILSSGKMFDDFKDVMKILNGNTYKFIEKKYFVKKY
jgi:8-oxo-dGTP pyrophosphatase MutT (NUDIX family)